MRRSIGLVFCVAAMALPAAGAVAVWRWWNRAAPLCDVLARGMPTAPVNGTMQANWRQEACGDGGFVTVVFTVVEVTAGDPARVYGVARISESDLARGPVVLSWLGPQHLSVHVPAALGVTLRPFEVPGLKLTVSTEAGRPGQ